MSSVISPSVLSTRVSKMLGGSWHIVARRRRECARLCWIRPKDETGQSIFLERQLPLEDRPAVEPGLTAGGRVKQVGRRHMEHQGMSRRIDPPDPPAREVEPPIPHQHEAALV